MTTVFARLVTPLVVASLLASCTHGTQQEPSPKPEDKSRSTIRWIPNGAADLMSPEGTFVRAAMESWDAAATTKGKPIDALRVGGYPGFEHAFNNAWKPEEVFGTNPFNNDPEVGTDYREIVELRREVPSTFTAGVCHYSSQTAASSPDGTYRSGGSSDVGTAQWITFGPDPRLSTAEQHSPPSNQKGSAKRPTDNVFGTWVITHVDIAATDLPQCKKLAPGTPENLPSPYIRNDPPPTLPPDPGWPTGSVA